MRSFPLESIDKTEYGSFELLGIYNDDYGEYWSAQVEQSGMKFITGNYYCIVESE